MKDESQGGDTCKGCPPQPEHKGGQDPPDPPMIYATGAKENKMCPRGVPQELSIL